MKIDIETKRTLLVEDVRYTFYQCQNRHGVMWIMRSRLHSFKEKIEGKTFVDDQFTTDWVKYV